ncbi:uncharacterized protein [Henckelia pumila]|uniref:uncharacterized protein n=1 Tax=Henckelia pumila TaxID=405737 RepID=UPI003C6E832B
MAANAQKFGTREDNAPQQVNEVSASPIDQKLDSLTSILERLVAGQVKQVKSCSICSGLGHPTDMCPTLQKDQVQQANAVGGFLGQTLHIYDPYSNDYNLEKKDNIQNLNTQVGQLEIAINKLEAHNSTGLDSHTVVNPRENISAITLKNGKELEDQANVVPSPTNKNKDNEIKVKEKGINQHDALKGQFSPLFVYKRVPLFSLALNRNCESVKELNETFRRYGVNIPILDDIKPVPRCAKILKESCNTKRIQNLKECQGVKVGENVSAVLQINISIKCNDPGMFSIPCTVGDTKLEKAMLDLGASINVMPYSVYNYLKLGPLNKTAIVIQMAYRSTIYPRGVIEDILVKVEILVFPTDFYVIDMKNSDLNSPILLGRPFLKTSRSIIDVNDGALTMKFDGEIVKFNIHYTMKYPSCESNINALDITGHMSQENTKFVDDNNLEEIVARPTENSNTIFFLCGLQESHASKIERKLPPDGPKQIPMEKGGSYQEMGISKKLKQNKHRLKFVMKILKWVKVDK